MQGINHLLPIDEKGVTGMADYAKYHNAGIVKENEIFLMFRAVSAISGHGCPGKPETRMDACRGRSRPEKLTNRNI